MIEAIAARHGARVERTPIGEANVAHRMRETGSVLGGEGNGGVILPLLHLARDAPGAAALVPAGLARAGASLGDLVATFPVFVIVKGKRGRGVFARRSRAVLTARFGAGEPDSATASR